ncbi:MAG: 30S ribosomal protein S6 [Candidatus Pacebacteria bacterium]|nr:30S ribosomal protein S6 [Candidatus Paceibacterota bacterium]MCF7862632.1 30S ribosomal protein S6 [Candidatus Paceibacterota bacterium]
MKFMSDVLKEEDIDSEKDSERRQIYEIGYLLVPTLTEENTIGILGDMKNTLENMGAEIISSEMPKMITLAYVMTKSIKNIRHRFDSAYFGWVKFELETAKIADVKKYLTLNQDFIRFLITKTVRENTLVSRRYAGSGVGRRSKEEKKEVVEVNEEEIDKEIDALADAAV